MAASRKYTGSDEIYSVTEVGVVSMASVVLLDRPHHLERQFLCLGQAFDTSDVEPFIWAVAAQGRYMFARVHLPNLDRSIVPTAGKEATVGTGAQGLHRSFVPLSRQEALATARIPPAERAITARAD